MPKMRPAGDVVLHPRRRRGGWSGHLGAPLAVAAFGDGADLMRRRGIEKTSFEDYERK